MKWYLALFLILVAPLAIYVMSYLWHHAQMAAWISKFNEFIQTKKRAKNEKEK
jgi:uncharacterized protein YxeA